MSEDREMANQSLIKEGEFCYDVDVLKSLEALIDIDPVMEQVQYEHTVPIQ